MGPQQEAVKLALKESHAAFSGECILKRD